MQIHQIAEWFRKAVPHPTQKNFTTQLGVHIEEVAEMCEQLRGDTALDEAALNEFVQCMKKFSVDLKAGAVDVVLPEKNRIEFLDGICDQVVTGVGLAVYQNLDVESGLQEVADSNDSKFGVDGNPIFDENMKIIKGPNYRKPNLAAFV